MSLGLVPSPDHPTTQPHGTGRRIGSYVLRERIGEGGMGEVWRAERADGRFEQQVAVKLLHAGLVLPTLAERFRREGAILAKLAHPNIARLVDAGHTMEGQPYLVLEHVRGQRIDAACQQRRLSVAQRLALFDQVLAAVSHAHARLVIHRDIKPDNVLVTDDGTVKLLDFGIAKLLDADTDSGSPSLTQLNGQPLTPEYAAPEQLDQTTVTTATDVYALGLLLFLLLTGQHPRARLSGRAPTLATSMVPRASRCVLMSDGGVGDTLDTPDAWAAQLGTTPARLSKLLRGDLDNILRKALKHDPAERYPTVAALADDLRRHLAGEPVSARPDAWLYRAQRFVARHRLAVSMAALALVGIVGTAAVAVLAAREARVQRDAAVQQQRAALSASLFMAEMVGIKGPDGQPLEAGPWLRHVRQSAQALFFDEPQVLSLVLPVLVHRNRLAGRTDEADTVLADFARLAQQQHDTVSHAWARCLGALVTHQRERDAATLAELQATLASLPVGLPGNLGDFVRAQCLSTQSFFLNAVGRHDEAIAAQDQARLLLEPSPGLARLTQAEALAARATMLLLARRLNEADAQYQAWLALLSQRGQARSLDSAAALSYRGRVFALQGRWLGAVQHLEAAVDIARGMSGEQAVPVYMESTLATALARLGDCRAQVPMIDSVLTRLNQQAPGWADLPRMRALREHCNGDSPAALRTLLQAEAQKLGNSGIDALAVRRLWLAQLQADLGQPADALGTLDALLQSLPAADDRRAGSAIDWPRQLEALALRAAVLNNLGRWQEALDTCDTVAALLQAHRADIGSAPNAHDGQWLLQRARALAGLGRYDEAQPQASAALGHLQAAFGPGAAPTRAAQALLAAER